MEATTIEFLTLCMVTAAGQSARQKGYPITANPYTGLSDPERYQAWEQGWMNGAA